MGLHLRDIGFSYGEGGFSLSLPELLIDAGESVAVVGPSGSGKTTLLSLVAGILAPHSGKIALGGTELTTLSRSRRRSHRLGRIGMIFQSFELLDYLDVRDNILLQARLAPGINVDAALEARALELAGELGLSDKWRRRVTELSQGERQRVAACRAMLLDPPLVLADEPTGNLDPANKRAVIDHLVALCARDQRVLITVTHDHSLLPAFSRVVDMGELCGGQG